MRRLLLALLLLPVAARPEELKFAADRPVDILHLRLEAKVDLPAKTLQGRATIDLAALRPVTTIRFDAIAFDVAQVELLRGDPLQPQPTRWRYDGEQIELALPQPLAVNERAQVRVSYTVREPEGGLHFFGPTPAEPEVPYQVWSQGEAVDNRRWIPCFDHPNERQTTELLVTVPTEFQVLSNGRRVGRTENADGSATVHWRQDKDHVLYLVSLVVGKFAVVEESWRGRPVSFWVPEKRRADIGRSFGNTRRMLEFFSNRIGVEYPWDSYAQVVVEQFTHGGMENTAATTLSERTLHDERAHLDYSSDGLVAHELAHQWFGDLLTCREWAHTWLNEGFATYFEAIWEEHDQGADAFATNMLGKARAAIDGGRELPIVHRAYTGPWQQFDARSYPKGAWVLHMIRLQLGDELWWESIRRYVETHKFRCVETSDLRKSLEETTGRSFERFFFDWTERPGHPILTVTTEWNNDKKLAEIAAVQTQKSEAFHFPLRIEFQFGGAEPREIVVDVTRKEERFVVPLPEPPVMVRIDPEFSLLLELTEQKGRDLRIAQLRADPDPIARIRAAHHFGTTRNDQDRRDLAAALESERVWGVQIELAKALGASGGDLSRDSLLKSLTIEHPKARRAVVEALGNFRDDAAVEAALRNVVAKGDASVYVESAAVAAWSGLRPQGALDLLAQVLRRDSHNEVLREAALRGIGDQLDPTSRDLLLEWTRRGKPRACRVGALAALSRVARTGEMEDAALRGVVEALVACLDRTEHRAVKAEAAQTLRDLGQLSSPALPALEALSIHDPAPRVREQAKAAIDKIRAGAPAPLELDRLRKELTTMQEAHRAMEARLRKLEALEAFTPK
ncbi:MAG: M1 family aminopeptidase [Planctomycetaceae bacterium]